MVLLRGFPSRLFRISREGKAPVHLLLSGDAMLWAVHVRCRECGDGGRHGIVLLYGRMFVLFEPCLLFAMLSLQLATRHGRDNEHGCYKLNEKVEVFVFAHLKTRRLGEGGYRRRGRGIVATRGAAQQPQRVPGVIP